MLFEEVRQQRPDIAVVVDDEKVGHRGHSPKIAPRIGTLYVRTAPICFNAYTICRPARKPDITPAKTAPNLAPTQTGA
jgi:hypothetical protein